jgi:putative endonuclease
MREYRYYVCIIANATRVLYIGFTGNIRERTWEHKNHLIEGFTSHFHLCRLVCFEVFTDVYRTIAREKRLKHWRREKKIQLIERVNRDWHDLSEGWFDE